MRDDDELILQLILQEEEQNNRSQNDEYTSTEAIKTDTDSTPQQSSDTKEVNTSGRVTLNQETTEDDEIIFIEERDKTLKPSVWNTPDSEDNLDDLQKLPLKQSGTLENFLVVADSSNFSVRVEIDDHDVLDDSFNFIESVSNELSKVSGYATTDGLYVVSVVDYEFRSRFNALVKPDSKDVNFEVIRIELETDK